MGDDPSPKPSKGTPLSRRSFMIGGIASGLALGGASGIGMSGRSPWSEPSAAEAALTGPIPTFAFLNEVLNALGETKVTLFPFLESTGSLLRCRSYGGGRSGTRILVAAGAGSSPDATSADARYPYRHVGGIHSLYFHPGVNPVENLHLAGEDHEQFEFPGNVPFSVGAWIFPRATERGTLLAKFDEGAAEREWRLLFDGTTQLVEFTVFDEPNDATLTLRSAATLEFNKWHHVVGAYDGNQTLSVYIDGVTSNGNAIVDPGFASLVAGAASFLVGASGESSSPVEVFTGRMALPFICGKRLSLADVRLLFGLGVRLLGLA